MQSVRMPFAPLRHPVCVFVAVSVTTGLLAACASGGDLGARGDDPGDAATTADASAPHDGGADGQGATHPRDAGSGDGSHTDGHADGGGATGDAAMEGGAAQDGGDSSTGTGTAMDAASDTGSSGGLDASTGGDGGAHDAGHTVGPVTGGPCASGATGATAVRVEWIDAAGAADARWLVEGLPDRSNDSAGAYGYTIPFTPSFVDPYLAQGGVGVDDSDFIDISLSTRGLSSITSATLSIYGRSYDVSASGSFNWQTFDGVGQTAFDFVSNVAPYQWYSADMTTEIAPGEGNVLVRIKAGPSSGALVVNQVELCLVAN